MSIHWGGRGAGHINRLPRSIGQNPYSGATMLLDFTNPVLDPRITFSRGTNATLVDSTGKITYAPSNVVTYSQEFDVSAVWNTAPQGSANLAIVTANAGVAPDGTTTADRLQFSRTGTTSTDRSRVVQSNAPLITSTNYVLSIWLKSFGGSDQTVTLLPNFGLGSAVAVTVTSEWQRFSLIANSSTSTTGQFVMGLGYLTNSVTSADVLAWGAQLEPVTYQTTPGPYVATTASAYYGPRFDYDPVTLAPRGLLIEEARTNLLTYSEAISTGYAPVRATLVNNATAAPSGVVNATKIVEDTTATSTHIVGGAITSGATSSFSVFAKAAERTWLYVVSGTATAYFDLSTGAVGTTANCTGSTVNMGNGWYRCIISNFTTSTSVYVGPASGNGGASYTGNGTSGLFLWGLQLEAGAFATSYIPTVASTVSRSADVATMTGTNFSTWYNQSEGTFIYNATALAENSFSGVWLLNVTGGTNNNAMYSAFADTRQLRVFDGAAVEQAAIASSAVTVLQYAKVAAAYKLNDFAVSTNGGTVAADTSGTVPAPIQMSIGASGGLNGWVAQIAYYNTRLPNTQLQTLTAPSLASPLALDFISPTYTVGY
jgi:hypothetical protein